MKHETAAPVRIATTIRVSPETWSLLRKLAEGYALQHGGRPSLSATIERLASREAEAPRAS